jgi:hypothetical protein
MRLPCRPPKKAPTPAIPSILTLFPVNQDTRVDKTPTAQQASSCIGYGLEVVPIERCNTSCGKTVSPDTPEKEVVYATLLDWNRRTKPLPPLPNTAWKGLVKRKWYRLSVKQRIVILLCVSENSMMNFHRLNVDRISIPGSARSLVDHLPQPLVDQTTPIQTVRPYLDDSVVL